MLQTFEKMLSAENITEWGVCNFEDTLPLLDCAAKKRLPENAKSVIVTLFPYKLETYPEHNVSKYAIVPDYHKVCVEKLSRVCEELKKLYPDHEFTPFADNSPIREVNAAALAGLGVKGKNGLLINKTYGSYVFIAEIVTDLLVTASVPNTDPCIGCAMCARVCPTYAIENGRIAEQKCLSYITQKKGTLTSDEENLIKKSGIIWGCDVCSDICPMNAKILPTNIKEFREDLVFVLDYPESNREIKDRTFGFRGAQVIRRNLDLINQEGKR